MKLLYGGGLTAKDAKKGKSGKRYPTVNKGDFANKRDRKYPIPTLADAQDALRLARMHGNKAIIAKVYKKYPSLKKYKGGKTRCKLKPYRLLYVKIKNLE